MSRVSTASSGSAVRTAAALVLSIAIAAPAWAQGTASPRRWSIEVYGGGAIGQTPATGSALPEFPAGAILTTDAAPSRVVPSWYFGDGARLFNEVNASFASLFNQPFPAIVPLDDTLRSASARRGSGSSFGFRLTRRVTSRVDVEFSIGVANGTFELTDEARAAIEATRASFQEAFEGLFALMPQANLRITSTIEASGNDVRQSSIGGAVNVRLLQRGRLGTHVSAGVARVTNGGGSPQVRLRGNYQFRFLGEFPFNETDAVTISFVDREHATVGLVGGGLTCDLGARHGIRADARLQLGGSRIETSVDAVAAKVSGAPNLFLPSETSPSIQFSNVNTINSSLAGRLNALKTFTGDGTDTRLLLTVGYFVRF